MAGSVAVRASSTSVGLGERWARGGLGALVSVGIGTVVHSAAGHHPPMWLVVLTALACVPLCAMVAGVQLSRWRLGLGVVLSQGLFHALFSIFAHPPAASGADSAHSAHGAHSAHLHGEHAASVAAHLNPDTVATAALSGWSLAMIAGHLGAAALTYLFLRRGEVIVETLRTVFALRPIFLLLTRPVAPTHLPRPSWSTPQRLTRRMVHLWPGLGPWTLRGPPTAS